MSIPSSNRTMLYLQAFTSSDSLNNFHFHALFCLARSHPIVTRRALRAYYEVRRARAILNPSTWMVQRCQQLQDQVQSTQLHHNIQHEDMHITGDGSGAVVASTTEAQVGDNHISIEASTAAQDGNMYQI